MSTIALKKTSIKMKTVTLALGIAAAIALPQIFHAVGLLSGTGAMLGSTFLPMHIPVFLAGFLGGPIVGLVTGAVSPLLSFAISGMPAAAMLPFMMAELAGYGLISGLLIKVKMPVFFKLVIAQVGGRALRAIAILAAIYGFGSQSVHIAQIWNMVLPALPGILLQWALIPLLFHRIKEMKFYEGHSARQEYI